MISEDIRLLSFEKALEELEAIVRFLEEGKSPLEEAISSYERGIRLKKHCEEKLQEATLKIDIILKKPDGSLSTETQTSLEKNNSLLTK